MVRKRRDECQICGSKEYVLVLMGYIYKDKLVDQICSSCRSKYSKEMECLVSCSCDRRIGSEDCNHGFEKYDRLQDTANLINEAIDNINKQYKENNNGGNV